MIPEEKVESNVKSNNLIWLYVCTKQVTLKHAHGRATLYNGESFKARSLFLVKKESTFIGGGKTTFIAETRLSSQQERTSHSLG